MGLDSFRRYDVQARYAQVLAILSVFPLLAGGWLAHRNLHTDVMQIIYQSKLYLFALVGCAFLSGAMAVSGCLLGFNSAGQRRNDTPARSWFGFFLGGGVLTLDLILLVAFLMLRLEKPM